MEAWDKPKNCLSILPTILQISFQFKTMSLKLSRQRQTFERNWNAIKFFTPIVNGNGNFSTFVFNSTLAILYKVDEVCSVAFCYLPVTRYLDW